MKTSEGEAQRFIDIALREINAGNYATAIKLLKKAKEICPDSQAAELQELILKLRGNTQNTSPERDRSATASESASTSAAAAAAAAGGAETGSPTRLRHRKQHTAAASDGHATTSPEYTKEQLELVKKINKCKNFYQVLNVARDATDSEIKKSYKKLALQLHPDKNQAPGAAEAFKLVGTAVAVLTDVQKRKDYDISGADSLSAHGSSNNLHGGHQHRYHHSTFEATFGEDISAEELFNIFFGNFPTQGHGRRAYQSANQRQPHDHNQQPSLAFGLILVLILISMFSSFFTSDPVYSLAQSSKYPVRRETQHLSIPYYVKENFENDYQGSLGRLENSVEEDFIYTMKQNCYRERSYREAMMARARSFGSSMKFAQAQGLKMPSCDKLSKIGITRYSLY